MLKAWEILSKSRNLKDVQGPWMREEPLLHNPVVDLDILKSASVRIALRNAGITKIGHLITTNWEKSTVYHMCQSFTYELSKGIKRIQMAGGFRIRYFP